LLSPLHISLSTWFRDYVYIPLGGSHGGRRMAVRNTLIVFAVSGLWHGANWTFLVWGILNALYFLPLLLTKRNRSHLNTIAEGKLLPTLKVKGVRSDEYYFFPDAYCLGILPLRFSFRCLSLSSEDVQRLVIHYY